MTPTPQGGFEAWGHRVCGQHSARHVRNKHRLTSFSEQEEIVKGGENLLPWRSLRRKQEECGTEFMQSQPGRPHGSWGAPTPGVPRFWGCLTVSPGFPPPPPPALRFTHVVRQVPGQGDRRACTFPRWPSLLGASSFITCHSARHGGLRIGQIEEHLGVCTLHRSCCLG